MVGFIRKPALREQSFGKQFGGAKRERYEKSVEKNIVASENRAPHAKVENHADTAEIVCFPAGFCVVSLAFVCQIHIYSIYTLLEVVVLCLRIQKGYI